MSFPRVLGVDPSLTGTGLAHQDGRVTTFRTAPTLRTLQARHGRLQAIAEHVAEATLGHDLVVIEAPALSQGATAGTLDLWGAWWAIVDGILGDGRPLVEVAPNVLKKFATGRGNATKADMRVALVQRAGLDLRDDNQVDAWWLRAYGHQRLGHPIVNLPAAQAKLALPVDEVTS